ncbi:type II toxin-antitoxin system antitoxin DNA ADP-ribosyl glycohydrolase DarG [Planktothrix paucivesiculata]|uniref:Appr-1-p processing domain protein n=1 Tax=Planktothrix paucivesiculata PCC 9631 TaxID=671071 RepID=A0A7Z9BEN8_9CYAN|nr:macro domain-containing protein [Planktothrix paucivesiculata]VXD10423.1 Appr-1-p processing domain protein [Planktothrix paucivesiculata PCC 9631]
MIKFEQGNLLTANTEALVNTVNCVGVMGKGIALQFKQGFPENFLQYKRACNVKQVQPGKLFTFATGNLFNPKYIINFPTKLHWREKSKLEYIEVGLKALIEEIKQLKIQSVAIPPLGCGNGGLNWIDVKPLILEAFAELPEIQVLIFEPIGAPKADQIQVTTETPKMTRSRALFIRLLELYGIPGYRLTKLEIQKLAYFLQVAGEDLKLRYEKHKFGPYADNLNHVLQVLDGHFIQGYGDRSKNSEMYVLPEGQAVAQEFLEQHPNANNRLERVQCLIEGFETPYGLEMLATVHWVTIEDTQAAIDCEQAIRRVQEWSERKRQIFKPHHLCKAWERLYEQKWLN